MRAPRTWSRATVFLIGLVAGLTPACSGPERNAAPAPAPAPAPPSSTTTTTMPDPQASPAPAPAPAAATRAVATFGTGCFWCTEAVFERLDGVLEVTSGYMGGTVEHPTYRQVCTGSTGHAEVVQITFDPARIGYDTLLDWFFKAHDPTTLNRQGADEGTQYRSAIFCRDEAQQQAARAAITRHQPDFAQPIVTEVTAASTFWPAEAYHQDYFRNNSQQPYCRAVIAPKLQKLPVPTPPAK